MDVLKGNPKGRLDGVNKFFFSLVFDLGHAILNHFSSSALVTTPRSAKTDMISGHVSCGICIIVGSNLTNPFPFSLKLASVASSSTKASEKSLQPSFFLLMMQQGLYRIRR